MNDWNFELIIEDKTGRRFVAETGKCELTKHGVISRLAEPLMLHAGEVARVKISRAKTANGIMPWRT